MQARWQRKDDLTWFTLEVGRDSHVTMTSSETGTDVTFFSPSVEDLRNLIIMATKGLYEIEIANRKEE